SRESSIGVIPALFRKISIFVCFVSMGALLMRVLEAPATSVLFNVVRAWSGLRCIRNGRTGAEFPNNRRRILCLNSNHVAVNARFKNDRLVLHADRRELVRFADRDCYGKEIWVLIPETSDHIRSVRSRALREHS